LPHFNFVNLSFRFFDLLSRRPALFLILIVSLLLVIFLFRRCGAPDIDFRSLRLIDSSGKQIRLGSLPAIPSLVLFAASWCGPCRAELNLLKRCRSGIQGARILIVSDETAERIRIFKKSGPYPFEFFRLEGELKDYGVYSIPLLYVIDGNGKIIKKHSGMVDWNDASTLEHYKALLNL
jgi:thiol-disulfide isomerase/thioredoxin